MLSAEAAATTATREEKKRSKHIIQENKKIIREKLI